MASPAATPVEGHAISAEQLPKLLGIALFAAIDITLALMVVRQNWFSSLTLGAYSWVVWDTASLWAGRIVTIAGVLSPIFITLSKRKAPRRASSVGERRRS